MNYGKFVDVAIPLFLGILVLAFPQIYAKKTEQMTDDDFAKKRTESQKIGFVLLGVAAIYFFVILSQN